MWKTICVALGVAAVTSLSACVVAPADNRPPPRAYHDRDRDGDRVPNRYDRRPDNPYRY